MIVFLACDECRNQLPELIDGWKPACKAFPESIPDKILRLNPKKLPECANGYKFEPTSTSIINPLCDECKNKLPELIDGWNPACKAFPNGIADKMRRADPRKLPECANGYKFEPRSEDDLDLELPASKFGQRRMDEHAVA